MPFVLLIIGITLLVSGVQDTQDKLFALIQKDFTQKPSFLPWIVALLLIGMLGYIEPIKSVARAFLALVIIGILLSNKGFFDQLRQALAPYSNAGSSQV
jgi:hypothetical protein